MDYLKEAKENYEDARDFYREQYGRILEDFQFSNPSDPKQWDDFATKARKGRPTHTLDRTNQYVQHVVNKQREAKTSCDILPGDAEADIDAAKKIKGIVRHIEYTSKADLAWDTATDHQARGGLGWVRVIPKIVDPETNQQEILIQRVHDPLSCMLDPNSTEPDGSDAMFGFIETTLTNKAFDRLYPKAKKASFDSEGWFSDDTVRICEYLRIVEKEENRISIQGPSGRMNLTEDEYWELAQQTGQKPEVLSTFKAKTRTIKWCKLSGVQILEETEYPSQWIGLVPMMGHEIWIQGKRYLCGLVRRLMDGQRLHNYEMSALTESLMVQPKAPFLVAAAATEGLEDQWGGLNSGNPGYLNWNHADEHGNPIPPPQRLSPPNFPIAYANTSNMAVQEMENAVGMPKASLGISSNAISGRAKLADQNQGETATFHFADNRRVCQEQVYRIVVDMIPRLYDSRRIAKTISDEGQHGSVLVNPDQQQSYLSQNGQVSINPGIGRYDVRVKIGPSYTTVREEMGVKLQELGKGNPVLAAALTPILMKLSDMPEADKVARIAMAMLPPEVQKAYHEDDTQGIPPAAKAQIDSQGQQIQQMAQAMDQAGKVIQDLQGQVNDKNTKVQGETKTAMAQIQLAQEKLKSQADQISFDSESLKKDQQIAQLQLELWQEGAMKAVQESKAVETPPEQDVQQALMALAQAVSTGQQAMAKSLEQNTQVMAQLQELTVAALDEMAHAVAAPRDITLKRDPKTNMTVGATSVVLQ